MREKSFDNIFSLPILSEYQKSYNMWEKVSIALLVFGESRRLGDLILRVQFFLL
jgi:hypothetical protein